MGIGPDGLKNTAKGGVYVTLFISVGMNTIAWIFREDFGWKEFLTNVSEDVVKAAIAAVAGYLAGAGLASSTGLAVFSSGIGFIVGLGVGIMVSDIKPTDVRKFAEDVSTAFHRTISAVNNTGVYLKYQAQRVEDVAYCTIKSTGNVIVEGAVDLIRRRVDDYLRSFSPFNMK